jgi:hypothetical protein
MSMLLLGFKGLAWISSCYRFNNGGGRVHVCMESSMFGALLSLYVFFLILINLLTNLSPQHIDLMMSR